MTHIIPSKNLVLYADDDADDRMFVKEAFEEHTINVELITTKDGVETISFLEKSLINKVIPCLIILDINMPRMNGKQTVQKIKEIKELEHVPIILFSTSSQQMDKEFASNYKIGFLTKPIDYTEMEKVINHFFEYCSDQTKAEIRKLV